MKILISAEVYYPHAVGSAYATYRLANGLAKRGHEVSVICSGDSLVNQNAVEGAVRVFRISALPIPFNNKYHF